MRRAAFTLIELMIVVAIISILAVMAVAVMDRAAPRARLLADDSEIQQYLLKARTRAAQTRATQKVCLYSDVDPSDKVSGGRLLWLEWDDLDTTNTPTVPAATPVCTNEFAYASQGYTIASVAVKPLCTSSDGKWCVREEVDFGPQTHAGAIGHPSDGVSIYRFKDATGTWQSALKELELTYGPMGTIAGYSSLSQGQIQLSSADECLVPMQCTASNGTGFKEVFDVGFVLGGAVRASEGL